MDGHIRRNHKYSLCIKIKNEEGLHISYEMFTGLVLMETY
jgi:hypothetical protein